MRRLYVLGLWLTVFVAQAGEVTVENVEVRCDSDCDFSVTLLHADAGWAHYANRWEILSPDGEVLATRTLHHPHDDEQPFTRSLHRVTLPAELTEVLVRGNDSVHGAGKAIRVTLPKREK